MPCNDFKYVNQVVASNKGVFRETPLPTCGCYQMDEDRNPLSPMMVDEMKLLGNIPEGYIERIDVPYSDMKQCYMRFNVFERPIDPA